MKPAGSCGRRVALALVLLLGSAGFVAAMLFGTFGRGSAQLAQLIGIAPDDVDGAAASGEATLWRDLLAAHGSYAGATVRIAFTTAADAVLLGAAPAGEVARARPWEGDDPPRLKLGVVIVSRSSQRAVLGGEVVGVGDRIGEARVAAIVPGAVSLRWHDRTLTYDLDDDVPREFRSEFARRQRETKAITGDAKVANPEVGK